MLLSTLVILITSCHHSRPVPPYVEQIWRFTGNINQHLSQKHHFSAASFDVEFEGCINHLSLDYSLGDKLYSIDEARHLMVSCMDELITEINNDEEIRQYLKEYPFPMTRFCVGIFFPKAKYGNPDAQGELIIVTYVEGRILYSTDIGGRPEIIHAELYETAKEILSCRPITPYKKPESPHSYTLD